MDAYEYAYMREEDERARLDKAEQRREEKGKIDAVLGFYKNGVSVDLIANSLNISEELVRQLPAYALRASAGEVETTGVEPVPSRLQRDAQTT